MFHLFQCNFNRASWSYFGVSTMIFVWIRKEFKIKRLIKWSIDPKNTGISHYIGGFRKTKWKSEKEREHGTMRIGEIACKSECDSSEEWTQKKEHEYMRDKMEICNIYTPQNSLATNLRKASLVNGHASVNLWLRAFHFSISQLIPLRCKGSVSQVLSLYIDK